MVKKKKYICGINVWLGYGKHLYGHDDVKHKMDMDPKLVTL